ncbi:hypothetical protein ALNOE001_04290 [Candidatus Methanobinarius endosymbioticus]|uniref:Uncharacterized protein n=1 Tax=Candidatus Methanobinarius endosymbioticus TaxID=2006182 RepID=A0A366MD60_9EURY|nr:hypothetical protein ALNOE001_04290 [Candidatus Methanobinarius endosymbioticus]
MGIKAIYFSPTKTTEKIVVEIGKKIAEELKTNLKNINITNKENREDIENIFKPSNEDIIILGLPVYAGRIPEIAEEYINNLKGDKTKAIIVAVYGNRDYDDALLEMKNILEKNNFNLIGAGAFIGEHSFTNKLAHDRPDENDLNIAKSFAKSLAEKIKENKENSTENIPIKGNFPYKERSSLPPVNPATNDDCTECMECVGSCPTEAISNENPKQPEQEKCILCCECIKICPENAKFNNSEAILGLVKMLEENFSERKEPELFI